MLICRVSKRVASKMISQLNQPFLAPIRENGAMCKHPSVVSHRISCFSVSLETLNLTVTQSVKDSRISPPISSSTGKISRMVRSDAQAALFDYLHCTRGFNFTDAEHISKNSPHFLHNLLSKVEGEQDVTRALSRFLRYHPINEFEPFLESLGLSPYELVMLLPRDLMFLSDDQVLLDNFQVLCDYGVPRSKIGKIYKEGTEVFGYESGVLDKRLRDYENLGLSKSTIIKLVTCCPSLLTGDMNREFVWVLEKLSALGFKSDWIGGFLSSKHDYRWSRVQDTIQFLGEVGYSEKQMGVLFKKNPGLLFEGSGKRFYVLVGQLLKLGLEMNQVYSLFLENPEIYSAKCAKNLLKALHFLFEIRMDTEDIAHIVSNHMKLLGSHSLKGPKTVLRNFRGDKYKLCEIIKEDPLKLFGLASKSKFDAEQIASQNPGKFLEKTTFLLRLGYIENSDEMAKALKQFRGRGDQLQERFDCLVQAGLDFNVVTNMIKQAPSVLNQSRDVLQKKLNCIINFLGYPVESIIAFPSYLCYDMERINIRFSMYAWLRKKGAAKPMLSVSTLLACSDARFVKYFVDVHPEGPAMWKSLKTSSLSS